MSERIWLEREHLWNAAYTFRDWGYELAGLAPTFPEWWLAAGEERLRRDSGVSYFRESQLKLWRARTRPLTNCCMFTMTVIVGAAMRSSKSFAFATEHSNFANNVLGEIGKTGAVENATLAPYLETFLGSAAGMNVGVLADEGDYPRPGEWCLCQGFSYDKATNKHGGHSFFVVEADGEGDAAICLTLEANSFLRDGRGYIGHRGAPRVQDDGKWSTRIQSVMPSREEWTNRKFKAPTWGKLRSDYQDGGKLRFIRLNLLTSEVSIPVEGEESPMRVYFNNEAGKVRGLFPLGSHQDIHTGIHLAPKQQAAGGNLVRAMAPGTIVAMRLPSFTPPTLEDGAQSTDGADNANELARAISANDNGFVLMRHTLAKPKSAEKQFVYSLYYHLRRPDFSAATADGPEREVVWLKRLFQRYGSVTVVEPSRPDFLVRRWLAKDAAVPDKATLKVGGTYTVFKEDLKTTEVLDFTAEPQPLVLLRPPESELKEFFEELAKGTVVTLAKPFLCVNKRDVIGVFQPTSELGDGFLHWEVLTPGAGTMKKVLDFLNQQLPEGARLPEDFFAYVKESQDDNYFEEADELSNLVATLPDADAKEREPLGRAINYSTLRQLFAVKEPPSPDAPPPPPGTRAPNPLQLAFDTHADATKGSFRTELKIANGANEYKNLVPDGSYSLKVKASGGGFSSSQTLSFAAQAGDPVTIPLLLPGGTTEIEVTSPSGLFLDAASGPSLQEPSEIKRQVEFLTHLGKARLRRTVITHLNEWTKDGLTTSFKAREGTKFDLPWVDRSGKVDEAARREHVDAIRWWGVNSPEGELHELFGPAKGQLAEDSKTENVHPATFAWLLRILERARAIEFPVESRWQSDDAEVVAFAGILGVAEGRTKRRVGEPLELVVLQEVEPDGLEADVRLLLTPTGEESRDAGRGKLTNGGFSCTYSEQLWGELTLAVASEPREKSIEAQGGAEAIAAPDSDVDTRVVEVLKPELTSLSTPRWERNELVATLSFTKALPVDLKGWLVFRKWVDPSSPEAASAGQGTSPEDSIEFRAVFQLPFVPPKGLKVEHGFVEALPPKLQLSRNFVSNEYLKGAAQPARVSLRLIEGVQKLRDTSKDHGFSLSGLTPNGLELDFQLTPKNKESLQKLWEFFDGWLPDAQRLGKSLGLKLESEELDPDARLKVAPRLHVTDTQNPEAGGELQLRFSASAASYAAAALAEGTKGSVDVGVGVRVFNGATWHMPVPMAARADAPPPRAPKEWSEVTKGSLGELPAVWAPAPLRLAAGPHIVSAQVELVPAAPENPPLARVLVLLGGGDAGYWEKAAPLLKVFGESGQEITKDAKSTRAWANGSGSVTLGFPVSATAYRGKLTFKLSWKKSTFLGKEVAAKTDQVLELLGQEGATSTSYDNSPSGALAPGQEAALQVTARQAREVTFIVQTTGVHSGHLVELASAGDGTSPLGCVTYTPARKPAGRRRRALGQTDHLGRVKFTVSLVHFTEYLEGGELHFKVVLRDASDASLGDLKGLEDVTVTIAPPAVPVEPAEDGGVR